MARNPQARDILMYLGNWRQRANYLSASEIVDRGYVHFVVISGLGAFDVRLKENFARLAWSSLARGHLMVEVYPNRIEMDPGPWTVDDYEAALIMLSQEAGEIAPLVHVPYGIVVDGQIVAITFTAKANPTLPIGFDRRDLGLIERTFVANPEAFRQVCPPQEVLVDWYVKFWELHEQGRVVRLLEHIRRMTEPIRNCREGPHAWLQVAADGQQPSFVGGRYISWDITSHAPFVYRSQGDDSHDRPMKWPSA